jgi:EmrB/QacA subfamily drug resistance transporter
MEAQTHTSFWKKWGSLGVLSLALAIIVIDTTLLNVSLSTLIKDLNTDIQKLQWVITAYALMLAAFTITGGRLGDIFGRKKMFMLGAIIFAIGSLVASFSTSVGMLIWGESIIEGIGAVLMLPATSSLLVSNYKGRDRAIAFGVWGGIAAAASAVGPILGGYLTTYASWRWGFRINVVVVAILLIGSFLVKEARDTHQKPSLKSLDWGGVLLSAIGLLAFSFGIIEASTYGWWTAKEVFMIGNTSFPLLGNLSISIFAAVWGIIFLLLFILWELRLEARGRTPLVSMKLFGNTRFTSGLITTAVMSLGQAGIIFAVPVFYQAVLSLDAFHTGLGLLPLSISLLIAAPLSAFFVQWMYPNRLIMLGLGINIVAYIVLILSLSVDATVWSLAPGLALYGIGMGLVIAQISNITLSAVNVSQAGEASGLNNTMRQVGSTLGSAIIGSVLITAIATGLTTGVTESSVIPQAYKSQISQTLSEQSSNVEFGGGANIGANVSPEIASEITKLSHEATVRGNKFALLCALIFSFLAFGAASRLPKERNVERGDTPAAAH